MYKNSVAKTRKCFKIELRIFFFFKQVYKSNNAAAKGIDSLDSVFS